MSDSPTDHPDNTRLHTWEKRVEWPLAAIAVVFLAAFSVHVLAEPQGHGDTALRALMWVTWAPFAVDYVVRLALADDRAHWFVRHLVDLLIVVLPFLRPLRLLRLVVLIVALQKAIGGAIRGRVLIYTISGTLLLLYVSSLAILEEERYIPESTITNFGDALWWSFTTVTTVGYGEQEPVTTTGRFIAVALMIGGISLVGVVTATIASWIVQRVAEEDATMQAATAQHIDTLRSDTEARIAELQSAVDELLTRIPPRAP